MGRPSNREERRSQILAAFSRVLADHGYAGATIAAVANEADVAPGLIHHHFENKQDLLISLLKMLTSRFRQRILDRDATDVDVLCYGDAALKLDHLSDLTAAKCWVGIFAEAVRNPDLFSRIRRLIDTEVSTIQRLSRGTFSTKDAGAVLAFVIGSLVMGAFAPVKTSGFAAPGLQKLIAGISSTISN